MQIARLCDHRAVRRAFSAFSIRNYRLYWVGQLVSQIGTWIQTVALGWLVLTLTDSPLALGTVFALQYVPVLVLALFGGVLADRWPKRPLMMITHGASLAQALTLAVLTSTGVVQLWHLYLLAVVFGVISALDNPIRQAIVVELVGKDEVPNAVALISSLHTVSRMIGPALGGLAIAGVGFAGCFYLNAASYVAALGSLALMDPARFLHVPAPLRGAMLRRVGEGIAYAFRTPEILLVLIVMFALGTFGYNFPVSVPLIARYVVEVGPDGLGFLLSALGAGATVAALVIAYGRWTSARVLIGSAFAFSFVLIIIGQTRSFAVSIVLFACLGFASSIFLPTANTRLQLSTPDHLRGRVMSLWTLLFLGTTPFGSLLTGAVAERLGVPFAITLSALLCLVGAAAGFAYWRATLRTIALPRVPVGGR